MTGPEKTLTASTPASAPASTGRGEARRTAILQVAARLFADRPYDVLSIDEITREAGVAKGLIYYYFGSKRGLFMAVIEQAASALNDLAEKGEVAGGLSPTERLIRTLDAYLWWAETHRSAFQTITSGGLGVDSEAVDFYRRVRRRLLGAMSYGLVGSRDPRPTLRIALDGWLSFVEGATVSWLESRDITREEMRDLTVRVLGGTLQAVGAGDPDSDIPADTHPG